MAGNGNSGRRQQPEELARLKGDFRPSRAKPAGISGRKIGNILECCHLPGYDTLNTRSKRIYLAACKRVLFLKVLEPADLPELLIYAKEFDRYLQCDEDIERNGRYTRRYNEIGDIVGTVENPSVRQAKIALETVIRISSNFGFSPVDRQRLRAEVNPEDPTTRIVNIIMQGGNGPEDQ